MQISIDLWNHDVLLKYIYVWRKIFLRTYLESESHSNCIIYCNGGGFMCVLFDRIIDFHAVCFQLNALMESVKEAVIPTYISTFYIYMYID